MAEEPIELTPIPFQRERNASPSLSPELAEYNMVTDTVTGVNVRWKDNLFQAAFIFGAMSVCATCGAILAAMNDRWEMPWYGGAVIGAFAGLISGTFLSGVFLMIYRTVRHSEGKHD